MSEGEQDLFSPKKAVARQGDICSNFHQGADTSVAAFKSTPESVRSTQRAQVLHFITQRGSHGATCSEAETALTLSHQATSARITELQASGAIEYGAERRLTVSGRTSRVYRAKKGEAQ